MTTSTGTCLTDCSEVFHRSLVVKRKLCRKLFVLNETFSLATHLNLATSLKEVSGMSVELSYGRKETPNEHNINNRNPSICLLPRLAEKLGLASSGSRYKYLSDSFGATSTSAEITPAGNLKFVIGESPAKHTIPQAPQRSTVPVSSSAFQDATTDAKPKERPIVLHTWTACGFCQKQEGIIEEFKNSSDKNKDTFNDLVEIMKVDNPRHTVDKRVDSFPTWVKNGELIVGVQSSEKILELLKM